MKKKPPMDATSFRKELTKIMPGYSWVVHRATNPEQYIKGTGIQSSGFNRLSTLEVARRQTSDDFPAEYTVRSSGYGLRSPWLATVKGETLAQALRRLQDHYEHTAATYRGHATVLQNGRKVATTEE